MDRTRPVTIAIAARKQWIPKILQPPVVPFCSGFWRAPTGRPLPDVKYAPLRSDRKSLCRAGDQSKLDFPCRLRP